MQRDRETVSQRTFGGRLGGEDEDGHSILINRKSAYTIAKTWNGRKADMT